MNPSDIPPTVQVLGHSVAAVSMTAAIDWTIRRAGSALPAALVVTLNPEIVIQARADRALATALKSAELTVADGVGVLWAARRAGHDLPGRVPGVELATGVLEQAGPDLRVFFLGARPGVAERAAAHAHNNWGTTVAGHAHGYFDRQTEAAEIVRQVADSGAQLLLGALGEGQERFLFEHMQQMGVRVAIGVGGTLDVLAGEVERTPAWTRKLGVEWLWRVGSDRRRWHRFPRLLSFARLVISGKS